MNTFLVHPEASLADCARLIINLDRLYGQILLASGLAVVALLINTDENQLLKQGSCFCFRNRVLRAIDRAGISFACHRGLRPSRGIRSEEGVGVVGRSVRPPFQRQADGTNRRSFCRVWQVQVICHDFTASYDSTSWRSSECPTWSNVRVHARAHLRDNDIELVT
jgi:hypothetical protein